jgi:hypothetical protein
VAHFRAVLDVFDAFLSIESPHVFANAALDCIGCLSRHVRGSEERRQLEEIVEIDVRIILRGILTDVEG